MSDHHQHAKNSTQIQTNTFEQKNLNDPKIKCRWRAKVYHTNVSVYAGIYLSMHVVCIYLCTFLSIQIFRH